MRQTNPVFLALLFSATVHTSPLQDDSLLDDVAVADAADQPLHIGEQCHQLPIPRAHTQFFVFSASSDEIAAAQASSDPVGLGLPTPPLPRVVPRVDLPKCGEPPNSPPAGRQKGLYCCDGGIDDKDNGFDCIFCKSRLFSAAYCFIKIFQGILLTLANRFACVDSRLFISCQWFWNWFCCDYADYIIVC